MCFIGDCGAGKTTLSVAMLMCLGGSTRGDGGLQFICGRHVLYPGVVCGTAASIGTDHVADPGLYLQMWSKMTPRPPVFLAYRSKFVDLNLLQKISKECKVVIFDFKAPKSIIQERCTARQRQNPRTWPATKM